MLITNIKLFDGTSDNLIEDSSIWVEDNLIRYAGPCLLYTSDAADE